MDDAMKVGLPILGGIVLAYFTYRFGRQQTIDSALLEKKLEYAGKIAVVIQKIHELSIFLKKNWIINFSNADFQRAIDHFIRAPMFADDRQSIEKMIKMREELRDLNELSAIYLKRKFRNLVREYLALGQFHFLQDGLGEDNFHENFFENLLSTSKKRQKVYNALERYFEKLVR